MDSRTHATHAQPALASPQSTGIKIKYDCNEGTCKTCLAKVGNSNAKICVTRMPNKDVTIKWGLKN